MLDALKKWENKNFPGSVLYGVNHLKDNGWEPIYMHMNTDVGEVSKGTGGLKNGKLRAEWNILKEVIKYRKIANVIYFPVINFGILTLILKFLGIIKNPSVGLVHSVNYKKKILYDIYYRALDRIIFISEETYKEFEKKYAHYSDVLQKSIYVELMPEIDPKSKINRSFDKEYKYDVCLIGKTNRDYKTFAEAVEVMKLKGIIVGGKEAKQYKSKYIEVNSETLDYNACVDIYNESKINMVIVKEKNGIWGLTSLLDSFQNVIPVIATKTRKLSIAIEKDGYGLEVKPENVNDLVEACEKMLKDKELYNRCISNIVDRNKVKNAEVFALNLSKEFNKAISKIK